MGNTNSIPLANLQTNLFMFITINSYDSLFVVYGGKPEIETVRSAVLQNWLKGIQKEEEKFNNVHNPSAPSNAYKFKLNGYPFALGGDKENSIQSRKMCGRILSNMYNLGWKLLVSSDLSRTSDNTTWFFQKQNHPPDAREFMTIGISSYDKLQVNDCPENLHNLILEVISSSWSNGIQEVTKHPPSTLIIKLNGNPWGWVDKRQSCEARFLLKQIIQMLTSYQWLLYGNSNLKSSADTLFFRHVPTLQGGLEFLMVSLNRNDRLRLVNVPDGIIAALEESVRQFWYKGVQEVIDTRPECYELKLKGHPWWASGDEAIHSRMLILKLMERLSSLGYFILTGLDVSRKDNDKSVLLFQRGTPLQTTFLCISLNETDKIRLINAPENVVQSCRGIINGWVLGLQEEKHIMYNVSYQAKLKGNPWSSMYQGDGVHGRSLLVRLLEHLTSLGWRLVCSADVSAKYIHQDKGPDYPLDVHSWYFMYDEVMLMEQQQHMQKLQYGAPHNLYPSLNEPPPNYDQVFKQ